MFNWLKNLKFQFGFLESGNNYTESLIDFYNLICVLLIWLKKNNILLWPGKGVQSFLNLSENILKESNKKNLNNVNYTQLQIIYTHSTRNRNKFMDSLYTIQQENPEIINNSVLFTYILNHSDLSSREIENIFHQILNRPMLFLDIFNSSYSNSIITPISSRSSNIQHFGIGDTRQNIKLGSIVNKEVYIRYPVVTSKEVGQIFKDTAQNVYKIENGIVDTIHRDNSLSQDMVNIFSSRGNIKDLNENNMLECLQNLGINTLYFDDKKFHTFLKINNFENFIMHYNNNSIVSKDLD